MKRATLDRLRAHMKAHKDLESNGVNERVGASVHFLGAWIAGRDNGRPLSVHDGEELLLESAALILSLVEETAS